MTIGRICNRLHPGEGARAVTALHRSPADRFHRSPAHASPADRCRQSPARRCDVSSG